jgi:membrane associated rhomboid family serine protease
MSSEQKDKWVGRIVFVLALALAVAFITAVVTLAVSPMPFGGDTSRALCAGFGALMGIVGGYVLGIRMGKKRIED